MFDWRFWFRVRVTGLRLHVSQYRYGAGGVIKYKPSAFFLSSVAHV